MTKLIIAQSVALATFVTVILKPAPAMSILTKNNNQQTTTKEKS
jgi:hypothetical protein